MRSDYLLTITEKKITFGFFIKPHLVTSPEVKQVIATSPDGAFYWRQNAEETDDRPRILV